MTNISFSITSKDIFKKSTKNPEIFTHIPFSPENSNFPAKEHSPLIFEMLHNFYSTYQVLLKNVSVSFSICIVWEISTQLTIAHCELFWILVRFCQVLLGLIFPKPFFDKLIKIRQLEAGQEFSTPKKTQDPCVVCFFSNLLYFVKSFFFLHHIRKNTQGQFKNKHQFISF